MSSTKIAPQLKRFPTETETIVLVRCPRPGCGGALLSEYGEIVCQSCSRRFCNKCGSEMVADACPKCEKPLPRTFYTNWDPLNHRPKRVWNG